LGRPHWLLVDETHHLLPAAWEPGTLGLPKEVEGLVCVTVHPNMVAPAVLRAIDTFVAVGNAPENVFREYCEALGEQTPPLPALPLPPGEALVWNRWAHEAPFRLRIAPSQTERRRHSRKYAEGELPPDRSFYFRGPEGKLKLRAQNLILFLQMAEGVDDATWMHHLRRGDYSRWFRDAIKDDTLAAEAERVEGMADVSPQQSRFLIKEAIEERYTLPSSAPLPIPGTDAASRQV
jgi:hypothetical protein